MVIVIVVVTTGPKVQSRRPWYDQIPQQATENTEVQPTGGYIIGCRHGNVPIFTTTETLYEIINDKPREKEQQNEDQANGTLDDAEQRQ